MRIYVIRHGESEDDLDDSYGGAADFRLTDRGRQQAEEVGRRLKVERIDAIYNSPYSRALEAANIINDVLGPLPIETVDDLRERNSYGVLSGLTKKRAAELFGYVLGTLKSKPGYSREPLLGAEEFDLFVRRVDGVFHSVVDRATQRRQERIAIVTHGKFTQALFEEVLGINKDIYLDLSAINVIDYTPEAAMLISEQTGA